MVIGVVILICGLTVGPGALVFLGLVGIAFGLLFVAGGCLISTPQGLAITADAVRLESHRGIRRREVIDVRSEFWIELWLERVGEEKGAVHLFICSPDRRPTTYAIPLFTGSWQDAEEVASRVGDLLRLPPLRVLMTPPPAPMRRLANLFAEAKRRKQQMGDASLLAEAGQDDAAQARELTPLLVCFKAVNLPEAWLLREEEVTHQDAKGTRTNYAIQDIGAVDVEPEVLGKLRDQSFQYVYAVCLLLNSGESCRVRQNESDHDEKTDRSQAYLDARWTARYLRKVFGLPKP
jgi:hypothetical protein